jgi:hypothetical protein
VTRGRALLLCLGLFGLGGAGYAGLRLAGVDDAAAGITAEALLIVVVVIWTGSYLLRVVSGKMSFMEQRRRYRSAYDSLTTEALRERFASLSAEEQAALLREVGQNDGEATP